MTTLGSPWPACSDNPHGIRLQQAPHPLLTALANGDAGAAWVTPLILDTATNVAVGRAGFHGRPDAQGIFEVDSAKFHPLTHGRTSSPVS